VAAAGDGGRGALDVMASSPERTREHHIAEEQAALRRVATLVAQAALPEEVFAAVAKETGRLLDANVTGISRYDPDGMAAAVGGWADTSAVPFAVGTRVRLGGRNVASRVFETGRPARIDRVADSSGQPGAYARGLRLALKSRPAAPPSRLSSTSR
jgi:GAF domain-containing protein